MPVLNKMSFNLLQSYSTGRYKSKLGGFKIKGRVGFHILELKKTVTGAYFRDKTTRKDAFRIYIFYHHVEAGSPVDSGPKLVVRFGDCLEAVNNGKSKATFDLIDFNMIFT